MSLFQKSEWRIKKFVNTSIQNVKLQDLLFETGLISELVIFTTLFRKNENIGVLILPTVQAPDLDVLLLFCRIGIRSLLILFSLFSDTLLSAILTIIVK